MQREVWRAVVGYEGFYEVSDHGRVKSLARDVRRRDNSTFRTREVVLKPRMNRGGYLYVTLSMGGKKKSFTIHKLVAWAHLGEPLDGYEVRHLNGCSSDNRLENLQWGTQSENERDKRRHGTNTFVKRTHCPLGHALSEPNLRGYHASRFAHRACLACSRARARLRIPKNAHWDLQATADAYYRQILIGREIRGAGLIGEAA